MFWLILRTTLYLALFGFIWYGGQFYISSELNKGLHKMTPNTIFVDQNILNDEMNAKQQNGSFIYPFATITQGIDFAKENNISTIIINSGTYNEHLQLIENLTLYGNGDVTIKQPRENSPRTITTQNNTKLINLNIVGGRHSIFIPHGTSFKLLNSTVSGADDFGIKMKEKNRDLEIPESVANPIYEIRGKTKEELESLPLVRISNSKITKTGSQGLYLRDGHVEIINSQIIETGEEGIDLHPHMYVKIKNTTSTGNGESGLESEIHDNIVIIEDSTFEKNIKSGVAFITSFGSGDINLKNNTITENQQFGMRCAIHKNRPTKPKPFFQSMITKENNIIENNVRANIAKDCINF